MRAYGNGFTIVAAMRGIELPDPNRRLQIPGPRTSASTTAPATAPATLPTPTPTTTPTQDRYLPDGRAGRPCEGCGLPVTTDYVARTGRARHGCCPPAATTTHVGSPA